MAKTSPGLRRWRKRQQRGAVMKPRTFQDIKRKAAAKGADDPEKVAGKAYWTTARAKYRERKRS